VSLRRPDEPVREVVYPAVGEQTLKDLVAEARATESRRRAQVRTMLTGSYSHYYRQMLPELLEALEFRCNNTAYRPVMDAVELLHRYKDRDGRKVVQQEQHPPVAKVPLQGHGQCLRTRVAKPERASHGRQHLGRRTQRRNVDERRIWLPGRYLDGQPRLAGPASPDQGEQPHLVQHSPRTSKLAVTPDQRGQRQRKPGRRQAIVHPARL
jgi:hypothetical protein